ncbi:MAG: tRNA (adenosine(37)-N6)-threonylcarbamoyltransferase complex transferase subunit TsaD [Bacilli bacterium]
MTINILAIETSCDETSCAVIQDGARTLANIISSQMETHERYGGVVPEIASRQHVEQITLVIEEALRTANLTMDEIDAVAVTEGPGLVGALLVGVHAAKAIAFAHNKPLIPVHHIAGHIYANALVEPFTFPTLALIVSGGHTELVLMRDHFDFERIGATRDDACGEAYDKVARTLGLPYPGGPHVDRLAHMGEDTYKLPRVWLEEGSYDFSFSGLKSAVINLTHNAAQKGEAIIPENMAASFQQSVVEVLVTKTMRAQEAFGAKAIILCGGVAANRGLREALTAACEAKQVPLTIPPFTLCTDNAAMIGAAAYPLYQKGVRATMALNGVPSLKLEKAHLRE